jgi:hypothetical protein
MHGFLLRKNPKAGNYMDVVSRQRKGLKRKYFCRRKAPPYGSKRLERKARSPALPGMRPKKESSKSE